MQRQNTLFSIQVLREKESESRNYQTLTHFKAICYYIRPENVRKPEVF